MPTSNFPGNDVLDVAIVGGGLAGLIHLHYARRAGLHARVFERASAVGGLWRDLPAWQDIQVRPLDWTVGEVPIAGSCQPQILTNIESWVERFGLADGITTSCPVQRARHDGQTWVFNTPAGAVRARHLVAATGAHNRPVVPDVPRRDARVRELHSSALREPAELAGRDVVVVGGGASAFDLLDLCLAQGARRIVWVARGLRWFTPTRKPKGVAGNVRPLARLQAEGVPAARQSELIEADLRARYRQFGIEALLPERPLDVTRDQIFPGRARMLAELGRIELVRGEVQGVHGGEVRLSNGAPVAADLLLWGTGYRMDLGWFEDPQLAAVAHCEALAERCGCVVRSLDAPDLYFPAVLLDGFGAISWDYAVIARTLMSHIRGEVQLDLDPTPRRLSHIEMARHLARRDPASLGFTDPDAWCREIALGTPDDAPYPLP